MEKRRTNLRAIPKTGNTPFPADADRFFRNPATVRAGA
jgi:hypothetical protein